MNHRMSQPDQNPKVKVTNSKRPGAYRPPQVREIGALEHLQGRGGAFRDFRYSGYYPRHD